MVDEWRWFVFVIFVGGRFRVGGVCNEEWLVILDMCRRRSWFSLCAVGAFSLVVQVVFASRGGGVIGEDGVKGAGSRSREVVSVLLGGRCGWMVPF